MTRLPDYHGENSQPRSCKDLLTIHHMVCSLVSGLQCVQNTIRGRPPLRIASDIASTVGCSSFLQNHITIGRLRCRTASWKAWVLSVWSSANTWHPLFQLLHCENKLTESHLCDGQNKGHHLSCETLATSYRLQIVCYLTAMAAVW